MTLPQCPGHPCRSLEQSCAPCPGSAPASHACTLGLTTAATSAPARKWPWVGRRGSFACN